MNVRGRGRSKGVVRTWRWRRGGGKVNAGDDADYFGSVWDRVWGLGFWFQDCGY